MKKLDKRERKLVVVLALGLAVILIFAGAKLLDHGPKATSATTTAGASLAPSPRATQGSKAVPLDPPVFTGVDPFEPAITPAPSPTAVPEPLPSVAPPPEVSPNPSPNPSPTPDPSPSSPSTIMVGGHAVTLLDVFSNAGTDAAVVLVDGIVYTVSQGDTFAVDFGVESLSGRCGTFTWQDQVFSLCAPGI
jgi:hypothetical protein